MDAISWLKQDEALRLVVYDDANGQHVVPGYKMVGNPTIGYGRCLNTYGILPAEADLLLVNGYVNAQQDLQGIFGDKWAGFGAARQAAFTNMRYQLGHGGFRGFHQMITAAFNGAWDKVAAECLDSDYGRGKTKDRAARVAATLKSGEWPA